MSTLRVGLQVEDAAFAERLRTITQQAGYQMAPENEEADVIVFTGTAKTLAKWLRGRAPTVLAVVGSIEDGASLLSGGAYDVVPLPLSEVWMRHALRRAFERATLLAAVENPKGGGDNKPRSGTRFRGFGDDILPLIELEREAIAHALVLTDGKVERAAELLQIGRATLYRRIASGEIRNPFRTGTDS